MLKRLRTRSPEMYCAVTVLGFMIVGLITAVLLLQPMFRRTVEANLLQILIETPWICMGLLLLSKTGKLELVTRRGCGFLRGLLVGLYPVALIVYIMVRNIVQGVPEGAVLQAPWHIILYFISMLSVGIAEEFYFRGVFAETLLEKFGTSKAAAWKVCVLSSAVFGAIHISNAFTGYGLTGALQNIIDSFAIGILITAIYFRTGNLWVVAFIHGCLDFATHFNSSVYTYTVVSSAAATTTAAKMSFLSIILSLALKLLLDAVLYIAPAYFLLRDSKIEQVEQHFGEDCRSFAASRAAQQE